MTSSLVGSEMCIRDRILSIQHIAGILLNLSSSHHTVKKTMGQSSSISVSYTHLTLPTICSV
eukprot:6558743-Prorocentrum_lima.AAC.1